MKSTKVAITLPTTQLEKATEIANSNLGFKFPELVRYLLAQYIESNQTFINRLEMEYQKFLLEEKVKPSKAYTDVNELINDLENGD
ncbi:MAG: hypothetical protein R3A44_25845 [Caldilineaceae bacterium]